MNSQTNIFLLILSLMALQSQDRPGQPTMRTTMKSTTRSLSSRDGQHLRLASPMKNLFKNVCIFCHNHLLTRNHCLNMDINKFQDTKMINLS